MVRAALAASSSVRDLVDHTASYEDLDFTFTYRSLIVALDVKEKRQRYSRAVQELWSRVPERDLFIVDETVFRRVVWQGGGGYLAIHDVPTRRWVVFGPWELTLGRHVRYARWGQKSSTPFLKGKLLFNLASAGHASVTFDVNLVLTAVDEARRWRGRADPYPIYGATLKELGSPEP